MALPSVWISFELVHVHPKTRLVYFYFLRVNFLVKTSTSGRRDQVWLCTSQCKPLPPDPRDIAGDVTFLLYSVTFRLSPRPSGKSGLLLSTPQGPQSARPCLLGGSGGMPPKKILRLFLLNASQACLFIGNVYDWRSLIKGLKWLTDVSFDDLKLIKPKILYVDLSDTNQNTTRMWKTHTNTKLV